MTGDHPDTNWFEDELEITNLRPRSGNAGDETHLPQLLRRGWQRIALGLGLALLVVILLGGPLSIGDALTRASLSPTVSVVTLSPAQAAPYAAPTALARTANAGPALGPAPASCRGNPPLLTEVGPSQSSGKPSLLTAEGAPMAIGAIGSAPLLIGNFLGPYATMPLGPVASANAYGWAAPYSLYGWPAPITLILHVGVAGPVTLSGVDPRTGHPMWFGLVVPGAWGAPDHMTPTLSIDPTHPTTPVGGDSGAEEVWYGYAFVPTAGCYVLNASWPGGSWRITISAGAVQTRH